jgi:hypothetical protein
MARLKTLQVTHGLVQAGGDMHRLADAVNWSPDDRWFFGTGRPIADALGASRADVFVSGGRPRFLEINVGTCLNGGAQSSTLAAALLGSPIGRGMVSESGIRSASYLERLADWVQSSHAAGLPNVDEAASQGARVGPGGRGREISLGCTAVA